MTLLKLETCLEFFKDEKSMQAFIGLVYHTNFETVIEYNNEMISMVLSATPARAKIADMIIQKLKNGEKI